MDVSSMNTRSGGGFSGDFVDTSRDVDINGFL